MNGRASGPWAPSCVPNLKLFVRSGSLCSVAGEPWTLQYLRRRRRHQTFPVIWWPLAMPWGALLTAMTMFLMITSQWNQIGRICAQIVLDGDLGARPLAVLHVRPDRSVSLLYQPPGKTPGIRGVAVRRDYPVLPPPPLPEHLRRLAEKWTLVETEEEFMASWSREAPRRWFRWPSTDADLPPAPRVLLRPHPPLLLADEYRSHMDLNGMRRGLLEAQAAGISSDQILIEAEDGVTANALVEVIDFCAGQSIDPVFRMQSLDKP